MPRKLVEICVVILVSVNCENYFTCHDDPSYEPIEGQITELQFTWLGLLQYIHVKKGSPHFFRVPRVVLITRQFALSLAVDAAQAPVGYALGNVVFGEYERDEEECGLRVEDLAAGAECPPAVVLMPIADVLLHPEYKNFGATNSVALIKLLMAVKSSYMLPVCLPLIEYWYKNGEITEAKTYHIDYMDDVPRDHFNEVKEVITSLEVLNTSDCEGHDFHENAPITHEVCTSEAMCGFHSGAPTVVHEHTGHWAVIALALGGPRCPDPLLSTKQHGRPRHLLVQPYVAWISTAIAGVSFDTITREDPFGFSLRSYARTADDKPEWIGHWWISGRTCLTRPNDLSKQTDMFRFYHEAFRIKPLSHPNLMYTLDINAPNDTDIVCVKIGLPYKLGQPKVSDIGQSIVNVKIALRRCWTTYTINVEAWAVNDTET